MILHADVDFNMEDEDGSGIKRRASRRASIVDTYTTECANCSEVASAYIPPIVRVKGNSTFANERRRVVIVFLSLPDLAKQAVRTKGINESHLNDFYSALKSVLAKFEGF